MSQCVPSWELDDNTLHLDLPSDPVVVGGGWDKKLNHNLNPRFVGSGTLESLVNQAATLNPADALVPCAARDESTLVGSCSGATVPWPTSLDTCDREAALRCTSASAWTTSSSSGREYGRTTSASNGIPQRETNSDDDDDEEEEEARKRKQIDGIKSSVLRKRSRAAVHTQSERRRRDKIKQRMNTLHNMVSSSTKKDKASMLEEIIEYMKQLQAQVQWMKMNMSHMMSIVIMMQQQQHFWHLSSSAGMGVPDYSRGIPPLFIPPPPMPTASSWDNIQQGIDGYNRLAALYHQFQHPFASKNDN